MAHDRWTVRPEPVGYLGLETFEINADPPGQHWVAHTLTLEDARLVAAAPALLAALEESRREAVYLRDTWVGAGPSCARGVVVRLINRIDAAIKAARGQA